MSARTPKEEKGYAAPLGKKDGKRTDNVENTKDRIKPIADDTFIVKSGNPNRPPNLSISSESNESRKDKKTRKKTEC